MVIDGLSSHSICSRPEESLAQRTITLVARVEPLANTSNMELVHAVLAG